MRRQLVVLAVLIGVTASLTLATTAGGVVLPRVVLSTTLTGAAEVPGPGDPNGGGFAIIKLDTEANEVCWWVFVSGIEPATAAHIHRGTPAEAGPIVVGLEPPPQVVGRGFVQLGFSRGCTPVTETLANEIAGNPHGFYVNVHTAGLPAGAVRGQL